MSEMENRFNRLVVILGLATLLAGSNADAQEPVAELAFLTPLLGPDWTGTFIPPEPDWAHELHGETILDGHAVHLIKEVAAADFRMESLFTFDPDSARVTFVSQTNRGQLSTGTARFADGHVIVEGRNHYDTTVREFRQTFTILPDGRLEDRFYRREGEAWIQGHLIRYRP